jgi:hypothetical protein
MYLVDSPAVAIVPIIRLLLFTLAFAGIDEQFFFQWRRLNDFTFRRFNDHIATRGVRVIYFVGVVVRSTTYPDRRVIQRQKGYYKTEWRRHDDKARTIRAVPDTSVIAVSYTAMIHGIVAPWNGTNVMTANRIGAVMVIP